MGGSGSKSAPKPVIEQNKTESKPPEVDKRLPFQDFRDLFTLKNYWKTVQRNEKICKKTIFAKFESFFCKF